MVKLIYNPYTDERHYKKIIICGDKYGEKVYLDEKEFHDLYDGYEVQRARCCDNTFTVEITKDNKTTLDAATEILLHEVKKSNELLERIWCMLKR